MKNHLIFRWYNLDRSATASAVAKQLKGFHSCGSFIIAWLWIVGLLTACQATPPAPVINMTARRDFATTGYSVRGDFLYFYEQYGGLESLGNPISGEIKVEGWTVQYFERGRLERHPENEPRYRITVGWLGAALGRRQPPLPLTAIPSALDEGRYFPEMGHTLRGDFLTYFEAHGGQVRFGLPISEPFLVDGQLAQDFQSARFFWSPTHEPPVMLENIGELGIKN